MVYENRGKSLENPSGMPYRNDTFSFTICEVSAK